MEQAVAALRERGLGVCFEQVAVDREQLGRAADGSVSHGLTTFPMPDPARDAEVVLDALVRADPDYRWEPADAPSFFIVHPREGGALGWTVPARDWSGLPWIEAIRSIGLGEHGISLFPRGLERRPEVVLDRSLGEMPARRWLTAVVATLGPGHWWTLAGIGSDRSLVIGRG